MHVIKLFLAITSAFFVMQLLCRFLAPLHRFIGIMVVSVVSGWRWACYIKQQDNEMDKVSPDGLAVLVAGSDSESGYVACSKLAKYGYTVYGGARHLSVELCGSLRRHSVDVLEFSPDTDESVEKLRVDIVNKLTEEDLKLHAIVCNLDSTVIGEMEWISSKRISFTMEQGVVGTIRLVKAFLPLLRESRGRVIICSGLSGRSGIPGAALNSIANAALISVAECLRREMMKFRVPVAIVEPVWINYRTPISLLDTVTSTVNEVTNAMSYDLYEEYSKSYLTNFKRLWNRRIQRWYSDPADSVAVTICRAVNDTFVQPRYICGLQWERKLFALLEWVPDVVADILICLFFQPRVPICMNDEEWEKETAGGHPLAARCGKFQTIVQSLLSPGVSYAEHPQPSSSPALEAQIMKENVLGSRSEVPERDDSYATIPWMSAQSEEWMPGRAAIGATSPAPLELASEEVSLQSPWSPFPTSAHSSALSKGQPKKQEAAQLSADRARQPLVQGPLEQAPEHHAADTSRVKGGMEHGAPGRLSTDSKSSVTAVPTSLEENAKIPSPLKVPVSIGPTSLERNQEGQEHKATTNARKGDGMVIVKQPNAKERSHLNAARSSSGSFQPLLRTVPETGTSAARQTADTDGSSEQRATVVYKGASPADEDALPQAFLPAAFVIAKAPEVQGARMEDQAPHPPTGQAKEFFSETKIKDADLPIPEVATAPPTSHATNGVRKAPSSDTQEELPLKLHSEQEYTAAATEDAKVPNLDDKGSVRKDGTLSSHMLRPEVKSRDLRKTETTEHPLLPRGDTNTVLNGKVGSLDLTSPLKPQEAVEESLPSDELSETEALKGKDRMSRHPPRVPFQDK